MIRKFPIVQGELASRRWRFLAGPVGLGVMVVLLGVHLACGEDADLADREILPEELSRMVLELPDLGPAYKHLQFDQDESGARSNEDVVAESFDPEDDREDLRRFGRMTGYASAYTSPSDEQPRGVFFATTAVSLYDTADGASGDLRDEIDDTSREIGARNDGLRLDAAEQFDAGSVGDESVGVTLALAPSDGEGATVYGTVLAFRRGRLIGSVLMASVDDGDLREEAAEIARTLDRRIVAVLSEE